MLSKISIMVLSLATCSWTAAQAQEIYRWVGEDGVVHFSDTPPATPQEKLQTVEVQAAPPAGYDPAADIFNVEATRQRTQARREELQEQQAQRGFPERAAAPPVVQYGGPVVGYDLPYGYPVYPRPPRPNPPPRPRPPRPEPPADDTSTWRPPGRSDG